MAELRSKWNNNNLSNVELFAIGVAKAGHESVDESNKIGDGVVPLDVQLGGLFEIDGAQQIVNKENEYFGPDVMDTADAYHHVNTPDLEQVIVAINNQIKN